MHNSKKIRMPVLLVVLFVLINAVLDYALIPYGYSRITMHELETGEYEDIVVGTSNGLCSIDPSTLEATTGRKTLNACMGGEYLRDSYYLVKEACRKHTPKRVIYELDSSYWCAKDVQVAEFARLYQEMPWSINKLEYFGAKLLSADFRTTLFPWHNYKKQITAIPQTVAVKQSSAYKAYDLSYFDSEAQSYREGGFVYRNRIDMEKIPPEDGTQFAEKEVIADQLKYFGKLADFCKKKGIELIVVTTPIPEVSQSEYGLDNETAYAYFTELTGKYEVTYYDFNYLETGLDRSLDSYVDYDGHMYGDKAEEFSSLLATYLK